MSDDRDFVLPDLQTLEEQALNIGNGEIVRRASPSRRGAQRAWLRGRAHSLHPLAQVGHQGLTEGFARAVDQVLLDHELVKVKVPDRAPVTPGVAALWLHAVLGADVVQIVGKTLIVYRPHPEEPRLQLPS